MAGQNPAIGFDAPCSERARRGSGIYLLGQFDRHGFSAVASLAGPTFSQIDTLMDPLHAGGETKEGALSASAMRQRGADAIKLAKENIPFISLWATSWATDALIWHRLHEWINPGYLARSERGSAISRARSSGSRRRRPLPGSRAGGRARCDVLDHTGAGLLKRQRVRDLL
jgi:hypothetical protein